MLNRLFYCVFFICCFDFAAADEVLTFDDAVQRTLYNSPKLKISTNVIGEQYGLGIESQLLPNPEFAYSVENVFGNKNWHDWNAAESRYEVAQKLELGGKRKFRSRAAGFQVYAAEAGYEAKKLLVLNTLLKLFIEAVGFQEQFQVAKDQLQIADEVFKTVAAKVEAGRVSLIQQNKAEIAQATASIALQKAVIDFEKAKERLATMWGDACPDFELVEFPFYILECPDPLETCLYNLENNPELIQSQYEYLSADQTLNLEKAKSIPDVTVTVGYKTIRDTGEKGMILGAAFPIMIFNQNRGNIQKAQFESQKIREQYRELYLILENKLSIAHKELMRAYSEAELLQSTVLNKASQTFEFAQEGYKEGKFEYLDMLDSQRTLFEVRERYIQALINYHKSKADIEYPNSQEIIP